MCRTSQVLTIVVALMIAGASVAEAGWVLTDADGQETVISNDKMRSGWENGSMIVDADKNAIHFIDDNRKMIASGTVEEFCTEMEQIVETMMKNIPAEQREMMKQMMGSDKAAEVKIVKKGAGDKVSGFKTTRYEVMADGELYEELWLADDKDLMKDCKALLKMMAKFSSCMEGISSMGAPSPKASVEYMKIFEQGMIVKSVEHSESPMGNHADVTEIAKKDVPDSAFDLPEGYKAAPLGAMWGMGAE